MAVEKETVEMEIIREIDGKPVVNCTTHVINIYDSFSDEITGVIPLGNRGIIRVQEVTERTNLGIDVVVTRTRIITPPDYEIWEKSEGGKLILVVAGKVIAHTVTQQARDVLVAPNTSPRSKVTDAAGRVIGVRGLLTLKGIPVPQPDDVLGSLDSMWLHELAA